jgi:hypothetical protein
MFPDTIERSAIRDPLQIESAPAHQFMTRLNTSSTPS